MERGIVFAGPSGGRSDGGSSARFTRAGPAYVDSSRREARSVCTHVRRLAFPERPGLMPWGGSIECTFHRVCAAGHLSAMIQSDTVPTAGFNGPAKSGPE